MRGAELVEVVIWNSTAAAVYQAKEPRDRQPYMVTIDEAVVLRSAKRPDENAVRLAIDNHLDPKPRRCNAAYS